MEKFDMHIHSSYSDGEFDIKEILQLLNNNGIRYFSISDHDNIDSIQDVLNQDLNGLTYIKGVEIGSLLDDKYKLHILGYNIDEHCKELIDLLEELKEKRKKRFIELYELLEDQFHLGIPQYEIDSILKSVNIPGKPHLASLLLKYGHVETISEAFKNYLKYLYPKTPNNADASYVIDVIHKAKGIAILAHPKKYERQYDIDFSVVMDRLLELGIDGIEIYNSLHYKEDCDRYHDYAKKHNLITSGGSDYHGVIVKPHVKLGMMYKDGYEYEDISLLEELL